MISCSTLENEPYHPILLIVCRVDVFPKQLNFLRSSLVEYTCAGERCKSLKDGAQAILLLAVIGRICLPIDVPS